MAFEIKVNVHVDGKVDVGLPAQQQPPVDAATLTAIRRAIIDELTRGFTQFGTKIMAQIDGKLDDQVKEIEDSVGPLVDAIDALLSRDADKASRTEAELADLRSQLATHTDTEASLRSEIERLTTELNAANESGADTAGLEARIQAVTDRLNAALAKVAAAGAAVPPGNGTTPPDDGGIPAPPDQGTTPTPPDTGTEPAPTPIDPGNTAPTPPDDGGIPAPPEDGITPPPDAGTPPDAGNTTDAGTPPADQGTTPPDDSAPTDAGTTPPDAGTPPSNPDMPPPPDDPAQPGTFGARRR